MKIAVIGCGVVGGAISDGFERLGHKVLRLDPHKFNLTMSELVEQKPDICFICVPTPQSDDGSCDTSIVESVVADLVGRHYVGVIAIKSTVTPGFTNKIHERYKPSYAYHDGSFPYSPRFAFVPEFLREKSAFYDFTEGHDTLVVGTEHGGEHRHCACVEIFSKVVEAHGKYPKNIVHVTHTEAELVKYFSNVFNALRVTFANGFFEVCEKLNADYTKIKNAVATRKTFVDMYLDCNKGFRGFSGPCLPKDTAAFSALASSLGVDAKIFHTIVEDNKLYEPTVPKGMRER